MQPEIDKILKIIERLESLANKFPQKEFLSAAETSAYLNISTSYLYKLTSSRSIPHFKPSGKMIYFKRSDLDEWISKTRIKTKDEIETMATDRIVNPDNNKRKSISKL